MNSCTLRENLTSKLVEVIPNVKGLVIVPSVLVVNELYTAWKQNHNGLESEIRCTNTMINFVLPFGNS